MKKICLVVVAVATLLFTQCKKAETVVPTSTEGGTRVITVTANNGNGAKTDVDFSLGTVKFTTNDMIRYAYTSTEGRKWGYIRPASYTGSDPKLTVSDDGSSISFSITLENAAADALVDFFCADDGDNCSSHVWGFWDSYWHITHDFSTQDGTENGIEKNHHIMCGSAKVSSGSINVNLTTPIAIAIFDLSGFDSGENVIVYNASSQLNFSQLKNSELAYSFGNITLTGVGGNNTVYVAMGEYNGSVSLVLKGATSGKMKYVDFAKISRNTIYKSKSGGSITLTDMATNFLTNTFSVSDTKKVFFAKGNLCYNSSTWCLESNQYAYQTLCSSSNCGHFYWTDKDNYTYSATPAEVTSLSMPDNVDWGRAYSTDEKITVLTSDEWTYLLNRTDKKGYGTVNNVKGVILIPDVFNCSSSFTANGTYTDNVYSTDTWKTMEDAGAVFLPNAGCRYGTQMLGVTAGSEKGYYWAKNKSSNEKPYWVYVVDESITVDESSQHTDYYYLGASVRLVYEK